MTNLALAAEEARQVAVNPQDGLHLLIQDLVRSTTSDFRTYLDGKVRDVAMIAQARANLLDRLSSVAVSRANGQVPS